MPEQEAKRKRRGHAKSARAPPTIELGAAFDPAAARDADFDLDLDAARFTGKKGQAGTRTKSNK